MLYTESIVIVDVVNSSLSVKARDLYVAATTGLVFRRYTDANGVHFTPLSDASFKNGTYSFSFSNGDTFTCSSADAYPATSDVLRPSDTKAPLYVYISEKNGSYSANHDYAEINNAIYEGRNVWALHPVEDYSYQLVSMTDGLLTFSATGADGKTHYVTIDDTNAVSFDDDSDE